MATLGTGPTASSGGVDTGTSAVRGTVRFAVRVLAAGGETARPDDHGGNEERASSADRDDFPVLRVPKRFLFTTGSADQPATA